MKTQLSARLNATDEVSLRNLPVATEAPSLSRAMHHTHAILDLYDVSSDQISPLVVESALVSTLSAAEEATEELDALQDLLWRYVDFNLPTSNPQLVDDLFDLFLTDAEGVKPSVVAGRTCRFLRQWITRQASCCTVPFHRIIDLFRYVRDRKVTMSFSLWDLYREVQQSSLKAMADEKRLFYELVYDILSASPARWQHWRVRLLMDMKVDTPPPAKWISEVAANGARCGRAQDVAWMARHFDEMDAYFVESLVHCKLPGSLAYMEKLLLSDEWKDRLQPAHLTLLLQKWSISGRPDTGMRAESIFQWKERKAVDDSAYRPTRQDASYVIRGYRGNDKDAELFAHRYVQNYVTTDIRAGKPIEPEDDRVQNLLKCSKKAPKRA